jgi:drug/metabolite transporter (DMT)-like permease
VTGSAAASLLPGLALAAAGAIAFSGKAIIVKLAYRHGVDAVTLILLRMVFALPFFLFMAWWGGRGRPPLQRSDWLAVAGLGFCGYYLSSMLDFAGLQYVSAALERLILYLNPTLVMLLGWFLHGRRPGGRQWAGVAISYAGVLLVFGQEARVAGPDVAWGTLLVAGSVVTYAVYLVFSGQVVQRLGSLRLVGLATTVACVCVIAHFLAVRPLEAAAQVATPVLWLSVLNATACTALPVLLVMMAVERLGAAVTAQTGMIGPLSTIAMGAVLLDEPFTGWTAAGTALVIAGIFVFTRTR